jgi:hypothetical protein
MKDEAHGLADGTSAAAPIAPELALKRGWRLVATLILCGLILFSTIKIGSSVLTPVVYSGPEHWVEVGVVRSPKEALDPETITEMQKGFGGDNGMAVAVSNLTTVEITAEVKFYRKGDAVPVLARDKDTRQQLRPGEQKYFFPRLPSPYDKRLTIVPIAMMGRWDWAVTRVGAEDKGIVEWFNSSDRVEAGVPPNTRKVLIPPPKAPTPKAGVLGFVWLGVLAIAGPAVWLIGGLPRRKAQRRWPCSGTT